MPESILKNSVETRATASRFKISEHQLSLGLLALLLLAAVGYGIWLAVSPFLPKDPSREPGISRLQEGVKLFETGQWPKAIDAYHEMLVSDPDNGFATELLAVACERRWRQNWAEVSRLGRSTGNTNAARRFLEAEEEYFLMAKDNFEKLLEHARYRNRAYERLASIYGFRFSMNKNSEDADRAIGFLEEMIDNAMTTSDGIRRNHDLMLLSDHRSFSRVVQEENRIFTHNEYEHEVYRGRPPIP